MPTLGHEVYDKRLPFLLMLPPNAFRCVHLFHPTLSLSLLLSIQSKSFIFKLSLFSSLCCFVSLPFLSRSSLYSYIPPISLSLSLSIYLSISLSLSLSISFSRSLVVSPALLYTHTHAISQAHAPRTNACTPMMTSINFVMSAIILWCTLCLGICKHTVGCRYMFSAIILVMY